MSRDLSTDFSNALDERVLRPVYIIRLDLETDPLFAWTNLGTLTITPGQVDDPALPGTYTGSNVVSVGDLQDTEQGSSEVALTFPGVKLDGDLLNQIVNLQREWQNRDAYIWRGLLDEQLQIINNPTRVKTGVMDSVEIAGTGETGTVTVTIESHQSYTSQTLETRYIEQKDLVDSTDTSMDYVHDIKNAPIGLGKVDRNVNPRGLGDPGAGRPIFNEQERTRRRVS